MKKTREKLWVMILFFCMVILAGCREKKEEMVILEEVELEEELVESEAGKTEDNKIYVYICGQVMSPGVYEMDTESRVYEAIQKAGGLAESAAKEYVNQAELLSDGQKIYIPSTEELEQGMRWQENMLYDEGTDSAGKVNINTANKEELMTLTGIGEKRAEAILIYRQTNGAFGKVEELMEVEGIKQGTYDKIKDQITVS